MINKLKGFAKDSLLYGVGDGLGRLTNIILLPILSRIFVPADYGIIDLLWVSYAFLLTTVDLNVLTGFQKFYYLRTVEERRVLVTSVISGICLFVSLITILIVTLSRKISLLSFNTENYNIAIGILGCCLLINLLFKSLILLLQLNRRAITYAVYNIINIVLITFITYVCVVWLKTGITGVFIAQITALCFIVPPLLFQQRHEFTMKIEFKSLKQVVLYSIPGHPSLIITSIMNLLPRYILLYFSTLTVVGLYGIAHRIAKLVNLYVISFNKAWNPFAFSNAGKPDEKSLYEKVFKIYAASLIFLVMIITLFAKEILQLLTPSQFHSAFILVGGICFYFGLLGLRVVFSTALYSVNRVIYTSYLNLVLLIIFLICAINLVPLYNAFGLIASLDIAAAIYLLCYFVVISKHFRFHIPIFRLLSLFVLACGGVFIFYRFDTSINLTITFKTCFIIIYAILNFNILFSHKEKTVIKENFLLVTNPVTTLRGFLWKKYPFNLFQNK